MAHRKPRDARSQQRRPWTEGEKYRQRRSKERSDFLKRNGYLPKN